MRDIIEGLRRADPTAIEQLVTTFGGKIYRVAHGITRNAADAEEVAQDVLLTVTRRIASFEGGSALWTWMYRITTNAALNKRRGKRHQVEVPLEPDQPAWKPDGHRDGDRAFLLADWSQRPDEVLLSKEGREILEAALARLPGDYRAVVVLRDVEGLSNDEVAEVLGDTVGSVKSRLHRARVALREHLTRTEAHVSAVKA
jgi:RNA polymerase sigma-70 factor (ECF subfamily)